MTEEEIVAVAAKVAEKLQPPSLSSPAGFEIVSHGVIDNRLVVMVKAPSNRHFVGSVMNWVEVPDPKV